MNLNIVNGIKFLIINKIEYILLYALPKISLT